MIRSIRDEISSWYMQLILILLVLSFVTFYGWSGSGLGAGNVASVGKEKFSVQDFQFQYQNRLQYFQSQGVEISSPEQQKMVQNLIISSFINERIRYTEGKNIGFVSSSDVVRDNIQQAFSDSEGNFNFDFYKNFVRNRMGKNPAAFEKEEGKRVLAQTFESWILDTSVQTPLGLENDYKINNNKRSISFVQITMDNVKDKFSKSKKFTDEQIETYYNDNIDSFTTEQLRQFEILTISKEAIDVQDENDFYKQAKEILTLVKNDPNIDYNTYADSQENVHFQDTGWISYSNDVANIAPEDVAMILNSSLSLKNEEQSDILQSRDGTKTYLAKLKGVQEPQKKPLLDVRGEIIAKLEDQNNQAQFTSYVEKLMTKWAASSKSLDTLAKNNKLEAKTAKDITFSSGGNIPSLGTSIEMSRDIFSQEETSYLKKPYEVDGKLVIAKIDEITQADMDEFSEKQLDLWSVSSQDVAYGRIGTITDRVRDTLKIHQISLDRL